MIANRYDLRYYGKVAVGAGIMLLLLAGVLDRAAQTARMEARGAMEVHEYDHHHDPPSDENDGEGGS